MKPQALNPDTACQFQLPSNINYARRKTLAKFLAQSVPLNYKGMSGSTLYFEFISTNDRDEFLQQLETMIAKHGTETARIN